jgi:diguanylate cyclase (GGDEF)-like protein
MASGETRLRAPLPSLNQPCVTLLSDNKTVAKEFGSVTSGIAVPLEWAVVLGASCAGMGTILGVWAGQARARRRFGPPRQAQADPLRSLFKPAMLAEALHQAAQARASATADHAVLHGRIDQVAALQPEWDAATRDAVRAHIAAVMRAGLRRGDRIAIAEGTAGAGFTIVAPGADEHAALRIANRLKRTLAKLRLPQLGPAATLTASFGVAAERPGETIEVIDHRARRALDAALEQGADHVVPASAIEEILLLPAPAKPVEAG